MVMMTCRCRPGIAMLVTTIILVIATARDIGYYKTLGVSPSASADEIKKGYRAMAMKYHPDKNSSPGADDKFKEVNEAFEVLKDEEKKQMYDQYGKQGLNSGAGQGGGASFSQGFDPMDTFRTFFTQQPGAGFGGHSFTWSSSGQQGFGGQGFHQQQFGGFGGASRQQQRKPRARHSGPFFDKSAGIVELTGINWETKIRKDQDVVLVMFYAPDDQESHNLKPKFERVATSLKGTVVFGATNCDQEPYLCRQYGVNQGSTPVLKLFGFGMHNSPETIEDRHAKRIHAVVDDAIPSFATKLNQATWFAFDRKTASRPRVILLTPNSEKIPSTFRALSTEFYKTIAFGVGDLHDPIFATDFKVKLVDDEPKLVFQSPMENGDLQSAVYKGPPEFKKIKKFIAKMLKRYPGRSKAAEDDQSESEVARFTSTSSLRASGLNVILSVGSAREGSKWSKLLNQLVQKYRNDPIRIHWGVSSVRDLSIFKTKGITWIIWFAKKGKYAVKPASELEDFSKVSSWVDRALGGDLPLNFISDLTQKDEL